MEEASGIAHQEATMIEMIWCSLSVEVEVSQLILLSPRHLLLLEEAPKKHLMMLASQSLDALRMDHHVTLSTFLMDVEQCEMETNPTNQTLWIHVLMETLDGTILMSRLTR
jgi:hypothetical protein